MQSSGRKWRRKQWPLVDPLIGILMNLWKTLRKVALIIFKRCDVMIKFRYDNLLWLYLLQTMARWYSGGANLVTHFTFVCKIQIREHNNNCSMYFLDMTSWKHKWFSTMNRWFVGIRSLGLFASFFKKKKKNFKYKLP